MISENWKEIRFKEFIELKRGFDLPNQYIITGKYPVVASTSIKAYHNHFQIDAPGVVTGRSGSLGSVQYIKNNFWPLNTTLFVNDFKNNDPRFVYYFLKLMKLENFNCGAGVPMLNRNHLREVKIKIPNIKTQKKIAAILSAYDDLIENNKRRIAILKKMAEEIYREWFVRSRNSNFKNKKQALIPLRNLIDYYTGGDWGNENQSLKHRNPVKIIRGTDFKNIRFGNVQSVPLRFITDSSLKNRKLFPGDIIIENSVNHNSRTSGNSLLITKQLLQLFDGAVICSSFCKLIRPQNKIFSSFLFRNFKLLFDTGSFDYFQNIATNGIANLQAERFLDKNLIVFSNDINFDLLNKIDPSIYALKIKILVSKRNMLLNRLISGKLSVEDLDIQFPPSMREENDIVEKEATCA